MRKYVGIGIRKNISEGPLRQEKGRNWGRDDP